MSATTQTAQPAVAPAAPNFGAIKAKQQATWGSGDYAVIGTRLQIVGELLAEAVGINAGERVLDVAAGNGNASLAAARRFAQVTSTDYVPALLEKGAERAAADGLDIDFQVADVEDLPFQDASFDVVLSTYGVMFAPDHATAAAEMCRVVRSGGRIGLANWTPDGFIGQLFKTIGRHVPPPAGVASPALWGTEGHLQNLFGDEASDIRCERRIYNFRFASSAHWLQVFRQYYGPAHKAFAALDSAGQDKLESDITELLESLNIGRQSLVVPSEYLEVTIVKH